MIACQLLSWVPYVQAGETVLHGDLQQVKDLMKKQVNNYQGTYVLIKKSNRQGNNKLVK